jgi:glycosyltransferase involved in cell wall biosynthesis
MQPKISIITITFNAQQYLEDTIKSVISQTYPHIEYLIVDGQSTDGTLAIIGKYTRHITQWISEPDNGIADAMNKGLTLSTGDFILFLHADDYLLHEHSIAEAVQLMQGNFYIFAFSVFFKTKQGGFYAKPWPLNGYTRLKEPFRHQGAFCHRKLFEEIGIFDTCFKIGMDYDFFLRAYRLQYSAKTIDYTVAVMRDTGVSSRRDWQSLRQRFAEERAIHFKNCANLFEHFVYRGYWMLYLPYRWLRARLLG